MEIFSAANLGPRVQSVPKGASRTKQSFREESEIENILARYTKTGVLDHVSRYGGEYGFASSVSFHEAMNVVTKADQMFGDLPAKVRRRFGGDPGDFLEFVQNPENEEELIELGLAVRRPEVEREAAVLPASAEAAPSSPEVLVDDNAAGGGPVAPPDTVIT